MGLTECQSPDVELRRYSEMEYILLGDLRDVLEETPDEHTGYWILAIVDALLNTLPVKLELKRSSGYLQEVLDEFPSWHRQVTMLEHEHERSCDRLQAVRERIAEGRPYQDVRYQLRFELRDWMQSWIAHNRHETRLLQTAINLEVGVGD